MPRASAKSAATMRLKMMSFGRCHAPVYEVPASEGAAPCRALSIKYCREPHGARAQCDESLHEIERETDYFVGTDEIDYLFGTNVDDTLGC